MMIPNLNTENAIINKQGCYEGNMFAVVYGYQKDFLREIIKDREFCLYKVCMPEDDPLNYRRIMHLGAQGTFGSIHFQIMEESAEVSSAFAKYVMILASKRGNENNCNRWLEKEPWREREKKFFDKMQLEKEEFLSFMEGKKLVFTTRYIEDQGNMESYINRDFCRKVLLVQRENECTLYDHIYDVRVFLQQVRSESRGEVNQLTPMDIRQFDVNQKTLDVLRDLSNEVFCRESDYACSYSMESEKITAQYFLTRYHNNPEWDENMVCIFNFRIAAFLLPGFAEEPEEEADFENKYTKDGDGNMYKIDSIHFTSDICFDLQQFKDLMQGHFDDVDLA